MDYALLDGIDANKTDPCTLQYLSAPICLLYKNMENKIVPIAIQVCLLAINGAPYIVMGSVLKMILFNPFRSIKPPDQTIPFSSLLMPNMTGYWPKFGFALLISICIRL